MVRITLVQLGQLKGAPLTSKDALGAFSLLPSCLVRLCFVCPTGILMERKIPSEKLAEIA